MKLKYIFLFSATLLVGTSCSDFLDKEPISDNVDGNFFTAENQLEPYCNNMYGLLPDHGTGTGTFGYFTTDNNSDDMTTVDQVDNSSLSVFKYLLLVAMTDSATFVTATSSWNVQKKT